MKIQVAAFTDCGRVLGRKVFGGWEPEQVIFRTEEALSEWCRSAFESGAALVFVGAVGIAVRSIAPYVRDKLTDCPVVVMDEAGKYVIPILSGHMGGANELARRIAAVSGSVPVITTATDLQGRFAVDVFARDNRLRIVNRDAIRLVSGKLLEGGRIVIGIEGADNLDELRERAYRSWGDSIQIQHISDALEQDVQIRSVTEKEREITGESEQEEQIISAEPEQKKSVIFVESERNEQIIRFKNRRAEKTLQLLSREYILGLGCKKGKSYEELSNFVRKHCKGLGICYPDEIAWLASIDRKREEEGLVKLSEYDRIPLVTYSAEELSALSAVCGVLSHSKFVEDTVGVGNVCERAALAAAGLRGVLVLPRQAEDGMTLAVAHRYWQDLSF